MDSCASELKKYHKYKLCSAFFSLLLGLTNWSPSSTLAMCNHHAHLPLYTKCLNIVFSLLISVWFVISFVFFFCVSYYLVFKCLLNHIKQIYKQFYAFFWFFLLTFLHFTDNMFWMQVVRVIIFYNWCSWSCIFFLFVAVYSLCIVFFFFCTLLIIEQSIKMIMNTGSWSSSKTLTICWFDCSLFWNKTNFCHFDVVRL